MSLDFGVSRQRAKNHGIVGHFDAAQISQLRQAQKSLVGELAGLEQHHEVGAAREWLPNSRLPSKQSECFRETSRNTQIVTGNVGPHRFPECGLSAASHARTTAANIFWYPVQRQRFPAS